MKALVLVLGILIVTVAFLGTAFWFLGPREPVEGRVTFDHRALGEDLDAYLAAQEADVPNLRPGAEKRIVWADPDLRAQTPLSLVYIHGFSATSEEIRPVPDRVAEALGANLVYTRLKGHGRDSAAMGEATVGAWTSDVMEAVAIGRRIGKQVILIGTSTGGTMATRAAFDGRIRDNVAGVVLVSPNFRVLAPGAEFLNMPWARSLVPRLIGETRSTEPRNEGHAKWWTTSYPSVALVPMAAAVEDARRLDHGLITVPLLVLFSDADQVVSAEETRRVAGGWGGPATLVPLEMGPGDDPSGHVVAGDIFSPGQTDRAVSEILDWVETLPPPPPDPPSL